MIAVPLIDRDTVRLALANLVREILEEEGRPLASIAHDIFPNDDVEAVCMILRMKRILAGQASDEEVDSILVAENVSLN